jgi:mannose-1-phosphate guanylyltransferase/mannose-6-phosphate isomerase
MIIPIIIAGGKGERLWPVSREGTPKPFARLGNFRHTLFQKALIRAANLDPAQPPIIVCNVAHEAKVRQQAGALGITRFSMLLEEEGRNTAPAICLAALHAKRLGFTDVPLLILAADHEIADADAFAEAVASAATWAKAGKLVTFAIKPVNPATGYGYLNLGHALKGANSSFEVAAFVEKPDLKTAQQFLADGNYAWNSGMFCFTADAILRSFLANAPDILEACELAIGKSTDLGRTLLAAGDLRAVPSISIDYAIMEKMEGIVAVKADIGWNDLGDWKAVYDIQPKDDLYTVSNGHSISVESEGTLLSSDGPLLVGFGLHGMMAIATEEAVLVAPLDKAQELRKVVDRLRSEKQSSSIAPWGVRRTLSRSDRAEIHMATVRTGAEMGFKNQHTVHVVCIAGHGQLIRSNDTSAMSPGHGLRVERSGDCKIINSGSGELVLCVVELLPD